MDIYHVLFGFTHLGRNQSPKMAGGCAATFGYFGALRYFFYCIAWLFNSKKINKLLHINEIFYQWIQKIKSK